MGFTYKHIHAYRNDCVLFWKENAEKHAYSACGESRWLYDKNQGKELPQKVLWHFHLKLRLQRLFVRKELTKDIRWHKDKWVADGVILWHPTDALAWKEFDRLYESS